MKNYDEKTDATQEEYNQQKKLESLFQKYGINQSWVHAIYEEYSGDDKNDVNWRIERAGWEFVVEKVLEQVEHRQASK